MGISLPLIGTFTLTRSLHCFKRQLQSHPSSELFSSVPVMTSYMFLLLLLPTSVTLKHPLVWVLVLFFNHGPQVMGSHAKL